ncbi:unnamed protein product [Linum trigynum]|uniref:Gnk2-homologous domain-containing protein n=1 Tax=Linum trigynum TaxID=586398 RepID=A0AAV2E2H4_9ROSI
MALLTLLMLFLILITIGTVAESQSLPAAECPSPYTYVCDTGEAKLDGTTVQFRVLDNAIYHPGCNSGAYSGDQGNETAFYYYSYCPTEFLGNDCRDCLLRGAHLIRDICPKTTGARYAEDGCCVRYETYQFC